jgi:DNA polymerase III delta prime subunit
MPGPTANRKPRPRRLFDRYLRALAGYEAQERFEQELRQQTDRRRALQATRTATVHAQPQHRLWAERFQPATLDALVGQEKAVGQLRRWMQSTTTAARARPVMVVGPCGSGKTCAVRLLAQETGRLLIECHADEARTTTVLEQWIAPLLSGEQRTLTAQQQHKAGVVLLIDELEGIDGQSEKGALAALARQLKVLAEKTDSTHASALHDDVAVVLVCHDSALHDCRALRPYCDVITFAKVPEVAMRSNADAILQRARPLSDADWQRLTESHQSAQLGDMRQLHMALQWESTRSASGETTREAKGAGGRTFRGPLPVDGNPFQILPWAWRHAGSSAHQALFRQRYLPSAELLPLFAHENYARGEASSSGDPAKQLEALALAADTISLFDTMHEQWDLDEDIRELACLAPLQIVHAASFQPPPAVQFPALLGKQSTTSANVADLRALGSASRAWYAAQSGGQATVRDLALDLLPRAQSWMHDTLSVQGTAAVPGLVAWCCETQRWGNPEQVRVVLEWGRIFQTTPRHIPPAVKAALTRGLNKRWGGAHAS